MIKRVVQASVLCMVFGLSACASVGRYPNQWHAADSSIRVYVSDSDQSVEIEAGNKTVTLLDAVFSVDHSGADLSRVVVYRRAGSEMIRLEVDVVEMVRTGETAGNVELRPGDVVGIAG